MIKRIIALAMVCVLSISMVACGPSKEMKALQAQYAQLQQAPLVPNYMYAVTKPFVLMGKLISTPQELGNALATRPAMVTCVVQNNVAYSDMLCESDMDRAGYKLVGKTKKGKNTEMVFQDNSSAGLQAAQTQRQQQLNSLQMQMNQQQQLDSQSNQTWVAVGVPLLTVGVGIAASIIAAQ